MTITNRDELIEAFRSELEAFHRGHIPSIIQNLNVFKSHLDWLSAQGFALVPLEPTEEMDDAAAESADVINIGFPLVSCIEAANEAGDLLREKG